MNSNQKDFDVGSYDILFVSDNTTVFPNSACCGRKRRQRKGGTMSKGKSKPQVFGTSTESLPVPAVFKTAKLTSEERKAANKAKAAGASWLTIFSTIMAALLSGKPILDALLDLLKNLKPKA